MQMSRDHRLPFGPEWLNPHYGRPPFWLQLFVHGINPT